MDTQLLEKVWQKADEDRLVPKYTLWHEAALGRLKRSPSEWIGLEIDYDVGPESTTRGRSIDDDSGFELFVSRGGKLAVGGRLRRNWLTRRTRKVAKLIDEGDYGLKVDECLRVLLGHNYREPSTPCYVIYLEP